MDESRKHFLLRRLHSLTGVIPLGAFLAEHFFTNAKSALGAGAYNEAVAHIQGMPLLIFIEVFGIFIPLIFHAVYGLMITARSQPAHYGYLRNALYQWQRTTGIIAFIYVIYHVSSTRIYFMITGVEISYDWVAQTLSNPIVLAVYILGTLAVTFHFANGLWNFLISWGITTSRESQKLSFYACMGIGVVLLAFAINSLLGFRGSGITWFQPTHDTAYLAEPPTATAPANM